MKTGLTIKLLALLTTHYSILTTHYSILKMNILDRIVARKKEEVALAKAKVSVNELEQYPLFSRTCYSLRDSVLHPQRTGIIAEYKRASPSKGLINGTSSVQEVVQGYQEAGASAVSVLTDADFFQGNLDDLTAARTVLQIPILRKEFIVDTYQIAEAKAYGADIILLIAACLTSDEIDHFSQYAKSARNWHEAFFRPSMP